MPARFGVLNASAAMECMEEGKVYERRLQWSHSSFVITVPAPIVRHLEAKAGRNIAFHTLPGKVVLTYTNRELTKKDARDIARFEEALDGTTDPDGEMDKYEKALDRMMGSARKDSERPQTRAGPSGLENLRIK